MNQTQQIIEVPVWAIVSRHNNRTEFKQADIEALADHIRRHGLINRPHYRRMADGTYEIIDGECRTRAIRDVLQEQTISAIVVDAADCSDKQALIQMVSENERRVAVNPIDQAVGWRSIMDRLGMDAATFARECAINPRLVTDRLSLLALCSEVQDVVRSGQFTLGYALVLAVSGLERNFQLVAMDLFNDNPSPTLAWWRAVCTDLAGKQNQQEFAWGDYTSEIKHAAQVKLPLPGKDAAPVVAGEDLPTMIARQIVFWQEAAGAWQARGKKHETALCQGAADILSSLPVASIAQPALEPTPDPRASLLARCLDLLADGQAWTGRNLADLLRVDKADVNSVLSREGHGRVRYDRARYTYMIA